MGPGEGMGMGPDVGMGMGNGHHHTLVVITAFDHNRLRTKFHLVSHRLWSSPFVIVMSTRGHHHLSHLWLSFPAVVIGTCDHPGLRPPLDRRLVVATTCGHHRL